MVYRNFFDYIINSVKFSPSFFRQSKGLILISSNELHPPKTNPKDTQKNRTHRINPAGPCPIISKQRQSIRTWLSIMPAFPLHFLQPPHSRTVHYDKLVYFLYKQVYLRNPDIFCRMASAMS